MTHCCFHHTSKGKQYGCLGCDVPLGLVNMVWVSIHHAVPWISVHYRNWYPIQQCCMLELPHSNSMGHPTQLQVSHWFPYPMQWRECLQGWLSDLCFYSPLRASFSLSFKTVSHVVLQHLQQIISGCDLTCEEWGVHLRSVLGGPHYILHYSQCQQVHHFFVCSFCCVVRGFWYFSWIL